MRFLRSKRTRNVASRVGAAGVPLDQLVALRVPPHRQISDTCRGGKPQVAETERALMLQEARVDSAAVATHSEDDDADLGLDLTEGLVAVVPTDVSSASGAPEVRIPVFLWAKDPISLAGLTAELRFRREFELLPGTALPRARVAVIASEALDETTLGMLRSVKAQGCSNTVLVISAVGDDDVLAAVDAGVSAIVWRWEATGSWLSEVVVKAASGEAALPSDMLARLLKRIERLNRHVLVPRGIGLNGLSPREIDVLRLAADGLDTDEIGNTLAYSARTVTSILHDVMRRYQLRNRTHAVAYSIREGLI